MSTQMLTVVLIVSLYLKVNPGTHLQLVHDGLSFSMQLQELCKLQIHLIRTELFLILGS